MHCVKIHSTQYTALYTNLHHHTIHMWCGGVLSDLLVKVYGVVEECWMVDEVETPGVVGHFRSLQQLLADLDARPRAEASGVPQMCNHGHKVGVELFVHTPIDVNRKLWEQGRT